MNARLMSAQHTQHTAPVASELLFLFACSQLHQFRPVPTSTCNSVSFSIYITHSSISSGSSCPDHNSRSLQPLLQPRLAHYQRIVAALLTAAMALHRFFSRQ